MAKKRAVEEGGSSGDNGEQRAPEAHEQPRIKLSVKSCNPNRRNWHDRVVSSEIQLEPLCYQTRRLSTMEEYRRVAEQLSEDLKDELQAFTSGQQLGEKKPCFVQMRVRWSNLTP